MFQPAQGPQRNVTYDIDDGMSNNTEDVRVKLPPEEKAFLDTVALACKEDSASIVRRLIREFLQAKRHEYTVARRVLHGEGLAGDSRGHDT